MTGSLEDRAAVVTGASSGLGRAIALAFAREGARVTVATRHEEPRRGGTPTADLIEEEGGEAQFVKTDVLSLDDIRGAVEASVEAFGSLDVMMNNAGIFIGNKPIDEVTEEDYDQLMAVNLKGTYFGCQAAVDRMQDQPGGGVIVNMSSASGLFGLNGASLYCASKGGISNLTRELAVEQGQHGIRVNAINPGAIETAMTATDTGEVSDEMARANPLGRIGVPEDVASVAVFLASDASAYVNGHNLVVDGGATVIEHPLSGPGSVRDFVEP